MNRKASSLIIIGYFLFCSGCKTTDFSRYPSLTIPQHSEEDYFNLLSNSNQEIVYNAVCNLAMEAEDIGKTLSDEKVDRNSPEFGKALKIYQKITQLLTSDDSRVVAASLRFLQLFCNNYKATAELLKPVMEIKNSNPQVQYEQITTLSLLVNKNSAIPDELLRKFLNNPSWVISRSAYLLVNNLEHTPLRLELIKKYRQQIDEKEKLLILTALEKNFDNSVAEFLLDEALSTESPKIRHAIFDMLEYAKDQESILEWVASHYDQILNAGSEYLFTRHASMMDQKFSSRMVSIFLSKGYKADEKFLEQLNEGLENYQHKYDLTDEEKDKLNNLSMIEKAVLNEAALAEQWKALRNKTAAFNSEVEKLQSEYGSLAQDFTMKVEELFKKHNIPDDKRQEFLKHIIDSGESLRNYLPK